MAAASTTSTPAEELASATIPATRRQIPAWLMSFLLHFTVFTAAAFFIKDVPRGIAGVEESKEAGIVLVSSRHGKKEYFDSEGGGGLLTESASDSSGAPTSAGSPFPSAEEMPKSPGPQLPTTRGFSGTGKLPSELPGVGGMTGSGMGLPRGKGMGKKAVTQVFGVQGEGSRFIYVFDRSGSMEGAPLEAAKAQLVASLESLDKVHQFQIIFYNQRPYVMQLDPGQPPGMEFANDAGKKRAESFIGSLLVDGGTKHMEALELALRLKPDVIFFLTVADDPVLTASDLSLIRRLNNGTSINAIEFGTGPAAGELNFLKRLAEQNHGNYGYVDISKL